jgi:hypothetical protein
MRPRGKSVSINTVGLCTHNEEWPFQKVRTIVPNFMLQNAQLLVWCNAVKRYKVNEITENSCTLNMAKELMT